MLKAIVLAEPTLVGRKRELAELTRFLDSVLEGKGATVLVSGEAGSGKTRLVNEFLCNAKEKGVVVLSGWCLGDAATPFFPFVEAFNSYFNPFNQEDFVELQKPGTTLAFSGIAQVAGVDREKAVWLSGVKLTEKNRKTQQISPEVWKDQVFSGVTKTLHATSTQAPMILLIEDIHWADSASLKLLHYVARNIKETERILVLATYRSEELTADAEGRPHPLTETLRMMNRENLYTEVRLSSLSHVEVSKIAENMIGGRLQSEFAEKLAKESRGNPLFIVESLRMLSERRNLVQENEEWRLAVSELEIPSKVRDIVLQRLAALRFDQRKMLDAASVIGERFDVALLGTVLGLDSLEVLQTLNMIAFSSALVCAEKSAYRFDHSNSREVLYQELSEPLRRGYHARVAKSLESKSGKSQFNEIAYHYAEAGIEEKAVEFALAAGQDALARFSNAEAIKHFTYVTEKTPDIPECAETRNVAFEGLGDAYYANGKYKKALEIFEHLVDYEIGKAKLRAYRKAMEAARLGNIDYPMRRLELARNAERYASSDRLEHARIRFLVTDCFTDKPLTERYGYLKEAVKVLEEEYSLPDVARALNPLGFALVQQRLHKQALPIFLRSIALYEEMGDPRGMIHAVENAGTTFLYCGGLFQEAKEKLRQMVQIGEKVGDYWRIVTGRYMLGLEEESSGRLEAAISQILKALEYYLLTDNPVPISYFSLATNYAKLGNLKLAEEYYSKFPTETLVGKRRHEFLDRLLTLGVKRVQFVLFAAKERWKEADECFEQGIELSKKIAPFHELLVRSDYAWALNRQGRNKEANVQVAQIEKIKRDAEKEFARVDVSAHLMAPRLVIAGEEFEIRLDLVNVSKQNGTLVRVEGLLPPEIKITSRPINCDLQNGSVEFGEGNIGAFQVLTVKVEVKSPKAGDFSLDPIVVYVDNLGETRTCKPNAVTVTVEPSKPPFEVLPNRVSTGCEELDALLFGGIPRKYAVVLASPSTDEREQVIRRFLETGATVGETTFYITTEAANTKALAREYPSNFYLIVCNPQADTTIQSAANVFKLKGLESLTDIDITLTKAFRTLNPSAVAPMRICIDIVSDVLLQHRPVATRRWLSSLLPTLKSKGFTILAVVDPQMHPTEELQSIVGIFDGEIRVTEKETPEGVRQMLRIRKLLNQKYLDKEIVLTKEKLS